MLADVICYWKMTSFMALDGVTSFLRLELKTSNVFLLFIVCWNRNRSAPVR